MASASWLDLFVVTIALAVLVITAVLEAVTGLVPPLRGKGGSNQAGEAAARFRTLEGIIDPRRTLTTSLFILQAIALVIATIALEAIFRREVGWFDWILTLVTIVTLYLILAQGLPRALSRHRFDETVGTLAVLMLAVTWPVRPLVRFAELVGIGIARIMPSGKETGASREDELRAIIGMDGPAGISTRMSGR